MSLDMPLTLQYTEPHSAVYCSSPVSAVEEAHASVNSVSPTMDANHMEHNALIGIQANRQNELTPVSRRTTRQRSRG